MSVGVGAGWRLSCWVTVVSLQAGRMDYDNHNEYEAGTAEETPYT